MDVLLLCKAAAFSLIAYCSRFSIQTGCMGGISGLIMAWVNELNSDDSESMYIVFLPNMAS